MRKFSHKKILGFLAIIAVLVAMLAPAMPVAADEQEWPLQLVGATTVDISQAEFEAMAAATPSNEYTDGDGNVWKGVALWRLIALVDDGNPGTFNNGLYSVYSVNLVAADGYSKTIAPADFPASFPFAASENIFVANKVKLAGSDNWTDLPLVNPLSTSKMWYPTRVNGSGCTANNQRVGALVKIELLNLPEPGVDVSIDPAVQSVANGATFNVGVNIDTEVAVRGWQLTVDFDAAKMSANSVTEGTFLSDYASANGGGTVSAGSATIDNTNGHVVIPGYAITGAGTEGPTGAGTLCTVSFTAKPAVNDAASVSFSDVVIMDVDAVAITGVTTTPGSVIIGSMPLPDLVVSAAYTEGAPADSENYTITYSVTNNGGAAAGASTTSIIIDGGSPIIMGCPALDIGESNTQTTTLQTLDGTADSILITADSASAVNESNEANNTRTTSYSYAPAQPGDVPVSGTTQQILTFVLPDPVSWDPLTIGENAADRTMKVLSNQDWQVTILGTNEGFMTKYDGATYDPSIKLSDALYVMSENNITLSGIAQVLADGIPTEQQLDGSGDVRSVIIKQQVYYTDSALPAGYYYLVVITFTASPTI